MAPGIQADNGGVRVNRGVVVQTERASSPISDENTRLVRSLFEERSLLDRVRRRHRWRATLEQIADAGDVRVVPDLLPLLAADDSLAPHVAAVIAVLVLDLISIELSWLDEQVRHGSHVEYNSDAWRMLAPAAVSRWPTRTT